MFSLQRSHVSFPLHTSICRGITIVSFALVASTSAHAQWYVVSLHPNGATDSRTFGTRNGQQVGTVDGNAALWTGTSASHVDLGPGTAVATDGQYQVGNSPGAVRWAGTQASRVPLPLLYTGYATGIDANVTCGYMPHIFAVYPAVWFGTSGSWLSSMSGGAQMWMNGISGTNGVGLGAFSHAALWQGLPTPTYVDLNPAGSPSSTALAVHGNTQVGWTVAGSHRAAMWTGTAASWVDLTPVGSPSSEALAVFDSRQVGFASVGGVVHASIWSGTAASWLDLHAVLPPGYTNSTASGVWVDSYGTTFVCGWATIAGGQTRALLWYEPAPSISFCAGDGSGAACPCANSGDLGRGCANSVDVRGGALSMSGSISVPNDQLTLSGDGVPNGPGLYYQGAAQLGGGLGVAFGDGLRCAGGGIVRLGIVSATGNASQYPRPGIDPSVSMQGGVNPGDTRVYQLYYRDTGTFCTPSGYNTTNALRITWLP